VLTLRAIPELVLLELAIAMRIFVGVGVSVICWLFVGIAKVTNPKYKRYPPGKND